MINLQCLASLHSGPDKINHSHKIIMKSSQHISSKYTLKCRKCESWQFLIPPPPAKLLREQYLYIPSFPKIPFSKSSQGKYNLEHLDHTWLLKMSFILTKIFSTSTIQGSRLEIISPNSHSNIKAELEKRKRYRCEHNNFKPLHKDWKIWIIFIRQAIAWSIICTWPNNNANIYISHNLIIIKKICSFNYL